MADDISPLHVAVTKDPAIMTPGGSLSTFGTGQWWYFTGTPGNAGNGGPAFDLQADMIRYPQGGPHASFPSIPSQGSSLVDFPIIAIDEQALYVSAYGSKGSIGGFFSTILIIPLEFEEGGVTKSMLDGHKPPDDLITILRPEDLPEHNPLDPVPEHEPDEHIQQYPVQEPFPDQQADNTQLFLSVAENGTLDSFRMAGLWFDEDALPEPRWRYTQRILNDAAEDFPLDDLEVPTGFEFVASSTDNVTTPDPDFDPGPQRAYFVSAVLAENGDGDLRVFAAHHVAPVGATDTLAVQWYVIDPDLDSGNFHVVRAPPVWNPTIEVTGRITTNAVSAGDVGECFHPVIGVTRDGTAYIEYTYSNGVDAWPQVRRVQLSSDYTTPLTNTLAQPGPANRSYEDDVTVPPGDRNDRWADYNDMQADPFACTLWSVHTLVRDPGGSVPGTIVNEDDRDIWLLNLAYNCFTPDLNSNMQVDPGDAVLFNDYYANEDPRADADADGDVTAIDAAIFLDAYAAGTP